MSTWVSKLLTEYISKFCLQKFAHHLYLKTEKERKKKKKTVPTFIKKQLK